jgi:hypothetical protein
MGEHERLKSQTLQLYVVCFVNVLGRCCSEDIGIDWEVILNLILA